LSTAWGGRMTAELSTIICACVMTWVAVLTPLYLLCHRSSWRQRPRWHIHGMWRKEHIWNFYVLRRVASTFPILLLTPCQLVTLLRNFFSSFANCCCFTCGVVSCWAYRLSSLLQSVAYELFCCHSSWSDFRMVLEHKQILCSPSPRLCYCLLIPTNIHWSELSFSANWLCIAAYSSRTMRAGVAATF
jgi:hypothetical protein